jgi:hypothetical protein
VTTLRRHTSAVPWIGPLVTVAAVAAYAWWATGVTPFTRAAYVAVGIPVALVAVGTAVGARRDASMSVTRSPATGTSVGAALPWAALGGLALTLELVALALGGRSHTVPTLSTVVDHALSRHPVRFVLFSAWLALAGVPLALMPLMRRCSGRGSEPLPGPGGGA